MRLLGEGRVKSTEKKMKAKTVDAQISPLKERVILYASFLPSIALSKINIHMITLKRKTRDIWALPNREKYAQKH